MEVTESLPEGAATLTLFCGQMAQTVEVAAVKMLRFGPETDIAAFPRIRRTYPGRAPDAAWRVAALERIERDRKHDFQARFTGADGKPLANAKVAITLRRHAFGFGSAVPAAYFTAETDNARKFREIVDKYFSMVVFENDLKDMFWGAGTNAGHKARCTADLDAAFAWLADRHIAVRGHYLMQVAVPPNMHGKSDDETRRHFLDTARERIAFAGKRVIEWDVINRPVAWSGAEMFSTRPALRALDREVFQLARSLTDLPMFVNEDQIFRPGRQSDETYDYIRALLDAGFKVDGMGNQAHMDDSFLPSPEHILAVTDKFAAIVPRQIITEFDVITTADEELAADYTRDILIATFSHPAYTGFLWWGFWEGSHWKPAAASWNKDWSIRKRGEVIEEWLGKRWRTEVEATTDAAGIVRWRGFPGWYEARPGGAATGGMPVVFQATKERLAVEAVIPAP